MYPIWPLAAFKTAGIVSLIMMIVSIPVWIWIGKRIDNWKIVYWAFVAFFLITCLSFSINNFVSYFRPEVNENRMVLKSIDDVSIKLKTAEVFDFELLDGSHVYLEAAEDTVAEYLKVDNIKVEQEYLVTYEQRSGKILNIQPLQ